MSSACERLYEYLKPDFTRISKKDNTDDLFRHPVVMRWHHYFLENWNSDKEIGLLLPCTVVKPYSLSPTHKIAYATLNKYNLEEKVQVYSVSEPMLLVPKELEECYPFNNYDYPPRLMSKEEKEEFIMLLTKPLIKVSMLHNRLIGILPRHHYEIVKRAAEISNLKITIYPYGRLAFKTIANVITSISS
ncbi:conserved hypothetical protein [Sulfolobus islandicus Y.G.57.14]|jgi:predicted RNA-binding protein|uniref:DUF5591 domain-containing protein n=7 Tax=Saccharolobus islandicus TaxID=43080 RepID=C3MJ94_SACI2|nr:DUF5591 domain-containing protein [Sulfolobus islandicus]ACP34172.1 conserved hypothetical protein [Sulfolobus islandicus L.S.2.15]ACP36910.1 conserved hypothetical protein [Sulfolobus islandicus M.14.25]ACP44312.1 conserved hypothetical protein [Sulfolobus islandicus Y.G.57.14]ACP47217.1 conserved hypothetical protein [Sulfolobus islandicus Y.N.15.51]ACP54047.1 conserved hypothetical protein [Sulfolobus islandicus M.16.27]